MEESEGIYFGGELVVRFKKNSYTELHEENTEGHREDILCFLPQRAVKKRTNYHINSKRSG